MWGKVRVSDYRPTSVKFFSEAESPLRPSPEKLYIGVTNHVLGRVNVYIPFEDRFRHVFICGATGTGKSTLIVNMVMQDMENGYGVCVIDPKGDTVDEILVRVPESRIDDVILIDPANHDKVVAVNFLEAKGLSEAAREVLVSDIVALMKQQTQYWGEKFGRIFETLVRAVVDFNSSSEEQITFADLYYMIVNKDFREFFVNFVEDPVVKDYLLKINEMDESELEPIVRRLNDWIMNKLARQMVVFRRSTFTFDSVLNDRKILLVRVPKGEVGESIMQLVGSMVISKLWAAAKARVKLSLSERRPFFLYIDEFSNFAFEGSTFDEILSEARAFRLGLILATQYPSQLSQKLREAVYANCGTIISFNCQNPLDAEILIKRFPNVSVEDLLSLDPYTALVRLVINDRVSEPFRIRTHPLKSGGTAKVVQMSLDRYGVKRPDFKDIEDLFYQTYDILKKHKFNRIQNLLVVVYSLAVRGSVVTFNLLKEEAKKWGLNVDESLFNEVVEYALSKGLAKLDVNYAIVPNLTAMRKIFWKSELVARAFEYFIAKGCTAEIVSPVKFKSDNVYVTDRVEEIESGKFFFLVVKDLNSAKQAIKLANRKGLRYGVDYEVIVFSKGRLIKMNIRQNGAGGI